MAVCFFALTACSGSKKESEPVPETIVSTMKTGAENYLKEFDSYDDETLATTLKRVQKQKNTCLLYTSCFATWNYAVKILGSVKTIIYIYMVPVITAVTSALILHEKMTKAMICGIFLTLLGLFLSEDRRKKERKN